MGRESSWCSPRTVVLRRHLMNNPQGPAAAPAPTPSARAKGTTWVDEGRGPATVRLVASCPNKQRLVVHSRRDDASAIACKSAHAAPFVPAVSAGEHCKGREPGKVGADWRAWILTR